MLKGITFQDASERAKIVWCVRWHLWHGREVARNASDVPEHKSGVRYGVNFGG